MSKKDIAEKNFLASNLRFADLVNGVLFQGKSVIKAEELVEGDTVISLSESCVSIEKICDGIRKHKLAVLIVENQETVEYAMPIRVMLRDAMEYEGQRKKIVAKNREVWAKEGYPRNKGEFLQGFRKEDMILPVVSMVLYWGKETWDGAKSLKEMLDYKRENEYSKELDGIISDYKIHVYDLNDAHDFSVFNTELREVFELYARRNDKKEFFEYYHSIDKQKITVETARFIGKITNSKRLLEMIEKEKQKDQKEESEVCLAIEEMAKDIEDMTREVEESHEKIDEQCQAIEEMAKVIEESHEKIDEQCQAIEELEKEISLLRSASAINVSDTIQNLMDKLGISMQQAMEILVINQ